MKIVNLEHTYGWKTRAVFRKSCNDIIIEQYKGSYRNPEGYRQVNFKLEEWKVLTKNLHNPVKRSEK